MRDLFSRRSFMKTAAVATAASISIPNIVSAAIPSAKGNKVTLDKNDIVLFQGDSITDWNRDKTKIHSNDPAGLSYGYAFLATTKLLRDHPDKNLRMLNRGISGNKVYQLSDRWAEDCLDIKPNVLSILIGVNDFWHTLTAGYKGTLEIYQNDYKKLLDRTKQALPNVKLIIGEPFAIRGPKVDDQWYPVFDGYRQAARDLASQYDAALIPYQAVFDKALESAPGSYWTGDGVHPTIAGTELMAEAWMETIKK